MKKLDGALVFLAMALGSDSASAAAVPGSVNFCSVSELISSNIPEQAIYLCLGATGPAYRFQVFSDGKLIWDGRIGAKESIVSIKPPDPTLKQKIENARLTIQRCSKPPHTEQSIFFGEEYVDRMEYIPDGNQSPYASPHFSASGVCLSVPAGGRDENIGSISSALDNKTSYRIIIKAE